MQGFTFIPIESFGLAMTTFVSQNLGANQRERVKKGIRFGVGFCCISAEVMGILFLLSAPMWFRLFGCGPEAVEIGVMKVRIDVFFYMCLAFSHSVSNVMRGAEKAKVPMLIMLGTWCVIRVIYIEFATYFTDDIRVVFWSYPLTWVLSCVLFYIQYYKLMKTLQ